MDPKTFLKTIQRPKFDLSNIFDSKQKTANFIILLILLILLPLAIYLATNTQVFSPRANPQGTVKVYKSNSDVTESNQVDPNGERPSDVYIQIKEISW